MPRDELDANGEDFVAGMNDAVRRNCHAALDFSAGATVSSTRGHEPIRASLRRPGIMCGRVKLLRAALLALGARHAGGKTGSSRKGSICMILLASTARRTNHA